MTYRQRRVSTRRIMPVARARGCWGMEGDIRIGPLISRVLPLEKINKAFDLVQELSTIRTVIEF